VTSTATQYQGRQNKLSCSSIAAVSGLNRACFSVRVTWANFSWYSVEVLLFHHQFFHLPHWFDYCSMNFYDEEYKQHPHDCSIVSCCIQRVRKNTRGIRMTVRWSLIVGREERQIRTTWARRLIVHLSRAEVTRIQAASRRRLAGHVSWADRDEEYKPHPGPRWPAMKREQSGLKFLFGATATDKITRTKCLLMR